jgi:hypothetical protein
VDPAVGLFVGGEDVGGSAGAGRNSETEGGVTVVEEAVVLLTGVTVGAATGEELPDSAREVTMGDRPTVNGADGDVEGTDGEEGGTDGEAVGAGVTAFELEEVSPVKLRGRTRGVLVRLGWRDAWRPPGTDSGAF